MSILENISNHKDLLQLDEDSRKILCKEIRNFLIENLSKTGGHVASNLGVVELTAAIETVYDTAFDRLVFDVGHQSYVHKMLTGRQADFDHLRQFEGIAGFPKPKESNTDAFVAGHASSSVSIGLGMARARTLLGDAYQVVVVMGDGAATGGMAYEALNDAAESGEPMVVILNDNALSIDRNVGGLARHLSKLRTKEKYLGMKLRYRRFMSHIPGGKAVFRFTSNLKNRLRQMLIPSTIFENMGFTYLGPVDGHDTERLISLLKSAKSMHRPVLLHVLTQKGKGYAPAQEHPKLFHGIGKFDPSTGEPAKKSGKSYSQAFGESMVTLGSRDSRICAITAAMPGGTGLLEFKQAFPQRLFDVGIAEEHAVSMAGGLAKQGMIPVVAIYSTFLQRAYDMILQDICLLGLHVVLAVDRAGLVGEDGETHHGVFDVGFLRQAPGMTVLCPGSTAELQDMLSWAIYGQNGPVAVRYPRGTDGTYHASAWSNASEVSRQGAVCLHRPGEKVMLITYGSLLDNTLEAAALLSQKGLDTGVLRLLTVAPLPVQKVADALGKGTHVVVLEEVCRGSGVAQELAWQLNRLRPDCRVDCLDLGHRYIPHGSMQDLYEHCRLDGKSVAEYVLEVCQNEN